MTGFCPPEHREPDLCLLCGLEAWGCICDPARPHRTPTTAELERAREARLTRAEAATPHQTTGKRG